MDVVAQLVVFGLSLGLYGCLGTHVYIGVGEVLQKKIDDLYRKYNVGIWWNRFLLDQETHARHESSLHLTLMLTSHPCMSTHSTSRTCWRHSTFTATLRGENSNSTLPKWPFKAPSVKGVNVTTCHALSELYHSFWSYQTGPQPVYSLQLYPSMSTHVNDTMRVALPDAVLLSN